MNFALSLFFGLLIVGLVIMGIVLYLIFWLKYRKIKRNAPEFEGEFKNWKGINYDEDYIERRRLNNGGNERRVEGVESEARSSREGEEQEEIRRIREQIARAERELAESRGK